MFEDEVFETAGGGSEDVRASMFMRKVLYISKEGGEAPGVGLEDGVIGGDIDAGLGLHVDESDIAEEFGGEFLGGEGLEHDDVVAVVAEALHAFFIAGVGEEVGDEDDESGASGGACGKACEGGVEVGFSL